MTITLMTGLVLFTAVLLIYAGLLLVRRVAVPAAAVPLSLQPALPPALLQMLPHAGQPVAELRPRTLTGLSKHEAENLLDWLEATGRPPARLGYVDGSGFTLSWN